MCVLLGWTPAQFWRSTPAEVASVLRALGGEDAMPADSNVVAKLMEAFPDG